MDNYAARFTTAVRAEIKAEASAQDMPYKLLAEASGVSYQSLLRYLSGERDMPMSALATLCNALSTSPAVIFARAESRLAATSPSGATVTNLHTRDEVDDWEAEDAMGYAAKKKSSADELDNDSV